MTQETIERTDPESNQVWLCKLCGVPVDNKGEYMTYYKVLYSDGVVKEIPTNVLVRSHPEMRFGGYRVCAECRAEYNAAAFQIRAREGAKIELMDEGIDPESVPSQVIDMAAGRLADYRRYHDDLTK